ncbi:uncharacterized protein LOC123365020 isoform X1 [Mauremys mutica]|uniref:uncharacterized protein LOC123365020 isoform X1 n=1 Tax=Mauremys mutica TaxID=74926 RepID=UPI001D162176|nr:uncharacterized protein LOC123365020 isoform X1 [Mauremys mutica]
MRSLLLFLNSASCLRILLLFLLYYAVIRLARSEASPRKRRPRKTKKKPKAFGRCEEEVEEAGASPETCCPVHLEKLPLAQSLWLLERRQQDVARYLDAVLIPPSVLTSATSQFSYSSRESTNSALWSQSSFSLREASIIQSEPLCHTEEIMPFASWEGSTHPIQAQPLSRPPAHGRRDRGEQTTGLDQTSVHSSDFNLRQKHLQRRLGAPQTPIPGESLLGKRDANHLLEVDTDPPKCGFPAKVPEPLRFNTSPQREQEIQEPCVCPWGLLPQKAHRIMASPDAILARLVPTAVVKLQDHMAQKCWQIQTKAFPKMVRESHRDVPLRRETALPGPLHPPREPGKHRTAAFPTMGQQPAHPFELHIRRQHPVMQRGLLTLDPEPLAKLPHAVPARGACVEFSEMETDFLQTGRRSTSSSSSTRPLTPVEDITMETGRNDGAAGKQTNPQRCTLPAGVGLTSPPPGTTVAEKTLAATLQIYRSELRKPLTCVSGTKGTEEKLELHMERKVLLGEGSCLRPGSQAGEGRADLPRTQWHQVAPEAPGSEQLTRSTLDSLIAGQAAHDLQIKQLTEMLSSSRPLVGQVSVCQQCHKAYPGKRKGEKTPKETSAELHGVRDIMHSRGFNGTVNSKLSRDQPPIRVCEKCRKHRRKRPAGLAGADLPGRSHGIPQRWTPGDSSASSNHNKMPVLWLLPVDKSKRRDGKGKRAPRKQPKMVSVATSTTGLSQAGEKASESPDGSPSKSPKASRARTPSPSRSKVLQKMLMCLKQTFSKLQHKVKSPMAKDPRSRTPDTKFTKPPFWKARASKGVRFPYY